MSKVAKQNAWAENYERLLNVEFEWDPDHLSNKPPRVGPLIPITIDMVKKAVSKMKLGKSCRSIRNTSSSLSWRHCHMSSAMDFPGRTYMQMILLPGRGPTDVDDAVNQKSNFDIMMI